MLTAAEVSTLRSSKKKVILRPEAFSSFPKIRRVIFSPKLPI
jgi:hypothetical protein